MKTHLITGLTALALCIMPNFASAQQSIGNAVAVDDRVSGKGNRKIRKNSKVYANERIRANDTGLGHFRFADGTKIVIGPGSNIVLDNLVYNPSGSKFNKFVLSTTSGAMRFISGDSASESYEINTPLGVLGIRGTAFDIQHYNGRTYIMMIEGKGEFCSSSGQCVTIGRKCDFVVINTDGSISDPVTSRRSPFGQSDMQQYFPLINNQSAIHPDFQLSVKRCASGRANASPGVDGANDSNGPTGQGSPGGDDGEGGGEIG